MQGGPEGEQAQDRLQAQAGGAGKGDPSHRLGRIRLEERIGHQWDRRGPCRYDHDG